MLGSSYPPSANELPVIFDQPEPETSKQFPSTNSPPLLNFFSNQKKILHSSLNKRNDHLKIPRSFSLEPNTFTFKTKAKNPGQSRSFDDLAFIRTEENNFLRTLPPSANDLPSFAVGVTPRGNGKFFFFFLFFFLF